MTLIEMCFLFTFTISLFILSLYHGIKKRGVNLCLWPATTTAAATFPSETPWSILIFLTATIFTDMPQHSIDLRRSKGTPMP